VSIDFGFREKHNEFRNNSFVYDWAIKTLELFHEFKKRTTIVFLGTNETLEKSNICSLFELAQKYDSIVRLNLYRPIGGINQQTKKFIPKFEVIKQALEYICKHYKILSISDPLFSSIFTSEENVHADSSGLSSIRILPDGSITPSTYLISNEFKKLNIQMKNVFEMLNKSEFKNLIDRNIPQECVGCEYETKCQGGAFDRRYLWYKDFKKKDPYCPLEKGKIVNIDKLKITLNSDFQSIHDGYLPTMFFSNNTTNINLGVA
jgi:radical SAM protein with 4Fe4S-binding SPASM domain